jgi:hypothetical protein
MKTKIYMQYFHSGVPFRGEGYDEIVEKQDSLKHAKKCNEGVFAFVHYNIEYECICDEPEKGLTVNLSVKNQSEMYYIDGKTHTVSDGVDVSTCTIDDLIKINPLKYNI